VSASLIPFFVSDVESIEIEYVEKDVAIEGIDRGVWAGVWGLY
jgi:hypothetical protein